MRFDAHHGALRPEPVKETPCSDKREVALRERARDLHRPYPAERDVPQLELQQAWSVAVGCPFFGNRLVRVEPGHQAGADP
ncbi:hypothetical protein GCM10010459_15970 [Microbacterium schleiferi]